MELLAWSSLMGLVMCLAGTEAYQSFREEIPNGYTVYNPCYPFEIINGVGHVSKNGEGPRNQFGQHFQEEGLKWTKSLCERDSDGDGLTNGYELGDPYCLWVKGATPTRKTGITAPGVNNKC